VGCMGRTCAGRKSGIQKPDQFASASGQDLSFPDFRSGLDDGAQRQPLSHAFQHTIEKWPTSGEMVGFPVLQVPDAWV
jgi:hypothetical protein